MTRRPVYILLTWTALLLSILSGADIALSALDWQIGSMFTAQTEFIEGRGMAPTRNYQTRGTYVNSNGFRRDELPPRVPGEIRLLMVGDSSCWGVASSMGRDWPAVVERELRAAGVPATTMNGGVSGYRMRNVFLSTRWFIETTHVDMIVIHGGWNDMWPYDRVFDHEFDFEETVTRFFPAWPDSLVANPDTVPYDLIPDPPANLVQAPPLLRSLVTTSPLAYYLVFDVWPRWSARFTSREPATPLAPSLKPHTRSEKYLFYLGLTLRLAQEHGIPVVLVKPFSSFRIPGYGYNHPDTWAILSPLTEEDIPLIKASIRRMDEIQEGFSRQVPCEVLDPAPAMLNTITAQNALNGYMEPETFHLQYRANALLGEYIAEELIATGLVQPVSRAPWQHPYEQPKRSLYAWREAPLTSFNPKRIALILLVAVWIQSIGVLLLTRFSPKGVGGSLNMVGWAGALGLSTLLSLTCFLYQFNLHIQWGLLVATAVLVAVALWPPATARFPSGWSIDLTKHVATGASLLALVTVATSEAAVILLREIPDWQSFMQNTLVWMRFMQEQPAFGPTRVLFAHIYQAATAPTTTTHVPMALLESLVHSAGWHAPATPFLPSLLSSYRVADPQDAVLVGSVLPAAAAAVPCWAKAFALGLRWWQRVMAVTLALAMTLAILSSMTPLLGTAICALLGVAVLSGIRGGGIPKGILAAACAGLALIYPTPVVLLVLLGLIALPTIGCLGTGGRSHPNAFPVLECAVLVLFGHVLLFRYMPMRDLLYDSLVGLDILLPFSLEPAEGAVIALTGAVCLLVLGARRGGRQTVAWTVTALAALGVSYVLLPPPAPDLVRVCVTVMAGLLLTGGGDSRSSVGWVYS